MFNYILNNQYSKYLLFKKNNVQKEESLIKQNTYARWFNDTLVNLSKKTLTIKLVHTNDRTLKCYNNEKNVDR